MAEILEIIVEILEMRKRLLWLDGKRAAHFKKSSTGVSEDTESADGEINEVDRY